MPRKQRAISKVGLYHVMSRGNNKSKVFQEEIYKKIIFKLMLKQERKARIELYGWCIMDNHIHIIIKSSIKKMSKAMQEINGDFARIYNYREQTTGHVFGARYKSEAIENETYLLNVIRYVHNNPVKAGIVTEPSKYGWSSYRSYLNAKMSNKEINVMEYYFNNKKDHFKKFHTLEDNEIYLDIHEDLMELRIRKAKKILGQYLVRHGLNTSNDLRYHPDIRDTVVKDILKSTELSIMKTCELTNLSYSCVQRIKYT